MRIYPKPTPQFVRLCGCGCGQPTLIAGRTSARDDAVAGHPKQFLRRHGERLTRIVVPAEDRFWAMVDRSGGPRACWLWTGGTQRGYGVFWPTPERSEGAHRYAYKLLVGPIPDGFELDHVKARGCTSTRCVNPAHLEAVTPRVNNLRSTSPAAIHAAATHCIRGHEFTPENTYIRPKGGRNCRTCGQRPSKWRGVTEVAPAEWLPVAAVAEVLGVGARRCGQLLSAGELAGMHDPANRGAWRVDPGSVRRYLERVGTQKSLRARLAALAALVGRP